MTPAEHATKAESLLNEAHSINQDDSDATAVTTVLAFANVHALLASRPAGPDLVPAHLLHQAEVDLEFAKVRYRAFEESYRALEAKLNQYGQDFGGTLDDIVDRVGELMELAYNSDRTEGRQS